MFLCPIRPERELLPQDAEWFMYFAAIAISRFAQFPNWKQSGKRDESQQDEMLKFTTFFLRTAAAYLRHLDLPMYLSTEMQIRRIFGYSLEVVDVGKMEELKTGMKTGHV